MSILIVDGDVILFDNGRRGMGMFVGVCEKSSFLDNMFVPKNPTDGY
jgi:hypothetical protein